MSTRSLMRSRKTHVVWLKRQKAILMCTGKPEQAWLIQKNERLLEHKALTVYVWTFRSIFLLFISLISSSARSTSYKGHNA